jgi:hypothetical protein
MAKTEQPLNRLARQIHVWAQRKGWYDTTCPSVEAHPIPRPFTELLVLIHAELSEALESWRNGDEPYFQLMITGVENGPLYKPEGWGVELVDTLIRLLDMCAYYKLDIDGLLKIKMAYNDTREHQHGGRLV